MRTETKACKIPCHLMSAPHEWCHNCPHQPVWMHLNISIGPGALAAPSQGRCNMKPVCAWDIASRRKIWHALTRTCMCSSYTLRTRGLATGIPSIQVCHKDSKLATALPVIGSRRLSGVPGLADAGTRRQGQNDGAAGVQVHLSAAQTSAYMAAEC